MATNNNDIEFGKTLSEDLAFKEKKQEAHLQKDKVKKIIMDKYKISSEDAEIIIKKLERKINSEDSIKIYGKPKNIKTNDFNYIKPAVKNNEDIEFRIPQRLDKNSDSNTKEHLFQQQNIKEKADVDSIIANLIPEYKQEVSVELKNVNLTFEIVPDKIDTLKETVIRTLKRNKPKKVKLHVLKDINIKIYNGEKVGIIGYNGAGKSTLLNLITGIYPPDTGTVITNGNISPLLTLGAGFDFNYSGRKNIYLNGAVLGYEKKVLQEKEKEIIEFSELEEYIDLPIKNYSSGMLAKLAFSIATILEPDILIIDEILGVGDVRFQKKSGDKIRSIIDSGTTVLLVSHSILQIRDLCNKAIWIDNGRVREVGEVNQVCDSYLKDSEKASNEQLANIQFK